MKIINGDEIKIVVENETVFSMKDLKAEKQMLKDQLDMPKPSNEELIEFGKMSHPYYTDKERLQARIDEINELIK